VSRMPVLYPMWLALAYMATLFVTSGASLWSSIRLFALTALLGFLVCFVATKGIGNRDRGAMVALGVVALLLVAQSPLHVLLVAAWIALVVLDGRIDARRKRSPWPTITTVASRVTIVILLAVGIRALQNGTLASVAHDLVAEGPLRPGAARVVASAPAEAPDIYLVLLDGYARADKLESLFGYDNSDFVGELERRGFNVAAHSRSNYLATELTLSSMFNVELLGPSSGEPGLERLVRMRRLVSDGVVWKHLREHGYETISIGSGFESVTPRTVDRFIDTGAMNELETVALRVTAVGRLAAASTFASDQHRHRVTANLEALAHVAEEGSTTPRFVLAHVPSPHAPVVFAADGSPVSADIATLYEEAAGTRGLPRDVYGAAYTGQVTELNRRVLATLDRILTTSDRPPVIIVFGDHGSASGLDWADLEHSDLDERTANLFASLTPGHDDLFGDDPTLVNTVGTLLNAYLGGSFEKQPDEQFRLLDDQLHFAPIEVAP
jgi:hypothetical protein